MTRRVLVCGGRDYRDAETVDQTLFALHAEDPITCIVHGDAPGADTLAKRWAYRVGVVARPFPADWKADQRAAGPIRNARMLKEGKPDLVVAFPGGLGTLDMTRRAENAGIPIVFVSPAE